jgi:hypothetical protein
MKRIFILGIISMLAVGSLLAKEDVLIDFTKLVADTPAEENNGVDALNEATTIDTSSHADNNFTDEQKALMKTSLAIENWVVKLPSSSAGVTNQALSYTKEADSAANGKVMGARIHFPVASWNATATIKPPFEIPAFEPGEEEGGPTKFEGGLGVVKNVGTVKSVAVNVYGLNFPYRLYVLLLDDTGKEQWINMGTLKFEGWAELRWDNPRYIQDVRNRQIRQVPLYPQSSPFVKFNGFAVSKDGSQIGGDFVAYFKDVKIIYDQAVLEEELDINDEGTWGIVSDREARRNAAEQQRQSNERYYKAQNFKKKATESFDQPAEEGAQ